MSMSAGGSEDLFKLAEMASLPEDRIMPSERKYLKSSKTVSLNEAISNLQARKRDRSKIIPGGLDDDTAVLSENTADSYAGDDTGDEHVEEYEDKVADAKNGRTAKGAKGRRKAVSSDAVELLNSLKAEISGLKGSLAVKKEAQPKQNDILKEFKSANRSVTFQINGMEFTVKCLNVVSDSESHCLVLVFSADSDSYFVPPMQSELGIKVDGVKRPGKLFYFGMNFSLKELGLRFLGFLEDSSEEQRG